jgi:hypothetical protein
MFKLVSTYNTSCYSTRNELKDCINSTLESMLSPLMVRICLSGWQRKLIARFHKGARWHVIPKDWDMPILPPKLNRNGKRPSMERKIRFNRWKIVRAFDGVGIDMSVNMSAHSIPPSCACWMRLKLPPVDNTLLRVGGEMQSDFHSLSSHIGTRNSITSCIMSGRPKILGECLWSQQYANCIINIQGTATEWLGAPAGWVPEWVASADWDPEWVASADWGTDWGAPFGGLRAGFLSSRI